MRERNFAYAIGRIRALETKLLDRVKLERLSEAGNLAEAIAGLAETEYAPLIANLKNPGQFEAALDAELARIIKLVLDLSAGAPEITVFIYRYDIQNIKSILKAELTGGQSSLSELGVWSRESLQQKLADNDLTELPPAIASAIGLAREAFKSTGDTQEIDRIIDAAWFEYGYQVLKEGLSELLFGWWVAFIDLTNLRSFVRLRQIGTGFADFERFYIPNGHLALDGFKELWDQPNERVISWIGNSPYHKFLVEGSATLASLTQLELEYDNYLIDLISPAKIVSLGVEPLAGYFLAKENEVKTLRIILVGKANQLSSSEIKERLRRAYA